MLRTIEAVIEQDGRVRLLESIHLHAARRALITILDETPAPATQPISPALAPDHDVAVALAAVDQTRGTITLDRKTLQWVAEDKDLEYGAAGAG